MPPGFTAPKVSPVLAGVAVVPKPVLVPKLRGAVAAVVVAVPPNVKPAAGVVVPRPPSVRPWNTRLNV